jgi:hypothetical protein
LPVKSLPWGLIYAGAPFSTFMREALEMRYLWQIPLRLDNAKLRRLIGEEPHTKLDEAVRETLTALGCLAEPGHDAGDGTILGGVKEAEMSVLAL